MSEIKGIRTDYFENIDTKEYIEMIDTVDVSAYGNYIKDKSETKLDAIFSIRTSKPGVSISSDPEKLRLLAFAGFKDTNQGKELVCQIIDTKLNNKDRKRLILMLQYNYYEMAEDIDIFTLYPDFELIHKWCRKKLNIMTSEISIREDKSLMLKIPSY